MDFQPVTDSLVPVAQQEDPKEKAPTASPDGTARGVRIYRTGQIDEKYTRALKELKERFQGLTDGNRNRREYMKKCLKLLEFFRGNQYAWWDYTTGSWQTSSTLSGGKLAGVTYSNAQALYVLNFMQGYLLSIMALLVGNKLTVRFFPDDPEQNRSLTAAQKGDVIIKEFERREMAHEQMKKMVFSLCVCGSFTSYVRTVTDGERFGYLDDPQYDWVDTVFGPPGYRCEICGYDLNAPPTPGPPDPMTGQPTPPQPPGPCENCGAPLPLEPNIPPPTGKTPVMTGMNQIPRARTMRTVIDGFEMKLPPEAAEQSEFPYMIWDREVDKSIPRSTWPEIARDIQGSSNSIADLGSAQEFERRIRRQTALGTTTENRAVITDDRDRVTLSQCWFRPRAFYHIDDEETRDGLLELFPTGVRVIFANDVYCESREESMDKHLKVCHALPGRGQVREPILGSLVPMQEIVNDLLNICRDIIEYTLPVTFVQTRLLDVRKWGRSQVMAGATYNVNDYGGRPISEGFFQTTPGQLPEGALQLIQQLRTEVAQFLSGAFPAAYGGGTPGNNTAQGIEIERQSALGRINLYLQALQSHYAEVAPLIVEDFANNAIEPIRYVDQNHGGEFVLTEVNPEDFDEGHFSASAEVVQEYPTTWAQRQALLLQMFQMPQFEGWLTFMKNLTKVKAGLGTELTHPQEDAYKGEFRTIYRLLKGKPLPGDPTMVPAGPPPPLAENGVPMGPPPPMVPGPPGPPKASIPITQGLDDLPTMFQACKDFYISEEGQKAKDAATLGGSAGEGWANFMAHVQELQMALMPPPAPPGLAPPGPGGPPGPPGPPPAGGPPPGGPPV